MCYECDSPSVTVRWWCTCHGPEDYSITNRNGHQCIQHDRNIPPCRVVTSSFPPCYTVIINHEEVAEIVNLMDSFIVTEPNFLSSKRKKIYIILQGTSFCPVWTPQPLTLAPPSAAVTELQVISHASLLWAWEFSLAQWTKLNSAELHSFVTLWVAGFVWPFSRPSAYTSSRFGWTELRHSGWEITLAGGVRGAAY